MAYPAATSEAWVDGHVHAFAFFGRVPVSVLYDNDRCLTSHGILLPWVMPPPAATTAWGGDSLLALSAERTDDLVALEYPADFLVVRPIECGLDVGRAKAAIGSDRQPRPFHRGKVG